MRRCYKLITVFCCYLLITACTHIPQKIDPKIFYKRDMEIEVNGHKGEGVLVVPKADKYEFDIQAKGKLDLFTFKTCHRRRTKAKEGEREWETSRKGRKFEYIPTPLESGPVSCPTELGGYEKKKGRHSWGFVDYEHPDLKLPALISCDGKHYLANGVSACDSYAGSIQEIQFSQQVLAAQTDTCIILKSDDDMRFRFKMPKGHCTFRFVTMHGEEKWHKMTTLGDTGFLIRE